MIAVGILAFIAGMIAGFISLRSLGWMVFVGLCCVVPGASGQWCGTLHIVNTTAGQVRFDSATFTSSGGSWQIGPGMSDYHVWNAASGSYQIVEHSSGQYVGTVTIVSGSDVDLGSFVWNGVGAGPTYFVSGCITNLSSFPARYVFRPSVGVEALSPLVAPGGYWCVDRTNNAPFTYMMFSTYYDEAGTNSWVVGPYWAWTNNVPGPGGTGSGGSVGGAPNNPIGSSSGAGSTNALTGGQFASGLSNAINFAYAGGEGLAVAINGMSGVFSNGVLTMVAGVSNAVSKTDSNSNALLGAILTNTVGILSNAAGMLGQTGTNALGTNMDFYTGAGWSNVVMSSAYGVSNETVALFADSHGGAGAAATNFVVPGEDAGGWSILWPTNTSGVGGGKSMSGYNFNPSVLSHFRNLAPWLSRMFLFALVWFGFYYVHMRIQIALTIIMSTPGGNPLARGPWGVAAAALGQVGVTVALAGAPILIGGAIAWFTSSSGTSPYFPENPLSPASVAATGSDARAVGMGVWLLCQVFPMEFAVAEMVYLAGFEMLVSGWVAFGQRVYRWMVI